MKDGRDDENRGADLPAAQSRAGKVDHRPATVRPGVPRGHPDLGRDTQGRGVARPDGCPHAADAAGHGVVRDGPGCLGGKATALTGAADLVAAPGLGAAGAARNVRWTAGYLTLSGSYRIPCEFLTC